MRRHAFDAWLDAAANDDAPVERSYRRFVWASADFVGLPSVQPWGFAAEDETAKPSPPSGRVEDIARELHLDDLNTAADIGRARRRFMWDNHPDRRADLDATLANRRVAIANMLLDQALQRLAGRRG